MKRLDTIGRAERIEILSLKLKGVPAKIDTGADSSAIWASRVIAKNDQLHCVFFGPKSPYYTGQVVIFDKGSYSLTRVANSFGVKELRYKVKLRIRVKGRLIRATFTLSDRSAKTYPILLGRRLLKGKFLVDVTSGEPMKDLEKARARQLKRDLGRQKGKEIT